MSKIVTLELRKGRVAYDENGRLISQADTFKIEHESHQWRNLMANIKVFGYTSAIVHRVIDSSRKEYFTAIQTYEKLSKISSTSVKELDSWSDKIQELKEKPMPEIDKSEIDKEVQSYFVAPVVKTDSADKDSIIADLQARLAALENKTTKPKVEEKTTETSDSGKTTDDGKSNENPGELERLRARFTELKGKAPHHKLSVETLKEAIEEMESKQAN